MLPPVVEGMSGMSLGGGKFEQNLEGVVQLFEVGLGVITGRALGRSFFAAHKTATVAAAPHCHMVALEHGAVLDFLQQLQETLFVEFLGNGNAAHDSRDFREAFLGSHFGEGGVHVGIFLILAACGSLQVFHSGANLACREGCGHFGLAALKELEQTLGVLLFLVGSFGEDVGNKHVAFALGLAGKVGVAVAGLGFTGKGSEDILLGLGSFQGFHGKLHSVLEVDFGMLPCASASVIL